MRKHLTFTICHLAFVILLSALFIQNVYAADFEYAPGQLIVKFKDGQTPSEITEDVARRAQNKKKPIIGAIINKAEDLNLARQGIDTPEKQLSEIRSVEDKGKVEETKDIEAPGLENVSLVQAEDSVPVETLASLYESLPGVEYAEPNTIVYARSAPNDARFGSQWALRLIQAPEAWDITRGSDSVIVSVVDSGVDYNHPDLAGRVLPGWNFIANNDNAMDDDDHGTHVAGIIGAVTNNNVGISGVNWNVKILPVKVLDQNGSGTTAGILQGIRWAADHGARIINMSLGSSGQCPQSWNDAIAYARSKGAAVVVASGQGYPIENMDEIPDNPTSCDGVISVSAVGPTDQRSSFSFYGNVLDIASPGGDGSLCKFGDDVATCKVLSTTPNNTYNSFNGTSMATPHVSGVLALLLSINPNLTPDELESIIKNTADTINTDHPIGKRVNAYRAVSSIQAVPSIIPSPIPTAIGFQIGESIDSLGALSAYTPGQELTFQFADTTPGSKFINVRFHYSNGQTVDRLQEVIYRPVVPTPEPSPEPSPSPEASPEVTPNPSPSPEVSPAPSPEASPTTTDGPGDVNHDGFVNALDLGDVIEHYGQEGEGIPADLNHDTFVNALDLGEVVENYGN